MVLEVANEAEPAGDEAEEDDVDEAEPAGDEAEPAGDEAEEDDVVVDEAEPAGDEAEEEADQKDMGVEEAGQGDGGQAEPVDGGKGGQAEAGRDQGGGDADAVTVVDWSAKLEQAGPSSRPEKTRPPQLGPAAQGKRGTPLSPAATGQLPPLFYKHLCHRLIY